MKRNQKTPVHLRLVDNCMSSDEELSCIAPPLSCQLSFPFHEQPTLVFVREADILHKGLFTKILENFQPRWIFDIRMSPRLDFLTPSRAAAFKIFCEMNLYYVDVLGQAGIESYRSIKSYPETWSSIVVSIITEAKTQDGPYIFIFDNDDVLRRSRSVLPKALQSLLMFDDITVCIFKKNLLAI